MPDVDQTFLETNGIKMHVVEEGDGPLVVLCHGFPECWYSWRHQLTALAQPALTKRIRQLESEIGGALFERTRNGTRLSSIGKDVLGL